MDILPSFSNELQHYYYYYYYRTNEPMNRVIGCYRGLSNTSASSTVKCLREI